MLDKNDLDILELFLRYSKWIKINNLEDTINNYRIYIKYIEKIEYTYGDWFISVNK